MNNKDVRHVLYINWHFWVSRTIRLVIIQKMPNGRNYHPSLLACNDL